MHFCEHVMRIAQLAPADAAAFHALRLRELAECPTAFASSYEEECDTPIAAVAERLAPRADGTILGAFMARDLVGVVGVRREEPRKLSHKAYMWGMYVALHARKAGVGRALVRHALSYARTQLHVRHVNLGVELTAFRGHLKVETGGVHHEQDQAAVSGGVSPATDRVGRDRQDTSRAGA